MKLDTAFVTTNELMEICRQMGVDITEKELEKYCKLGLLNKHIIKKMGIKNEPIN